MIWEVTNRHSVRLFYEKSIWDVKTSLWDWLSSSKPYDGKSTLLKLLSFQFGQHGCKKRKMFPASWIIQGSYFSAFWKKLKAVEMLQPWKLTQTSMTEITQMQKYFSKTGCANWRCSFKIPLGGELSLADLITRLWLTLFV